MLLYGLCVGSTVQREAVPSAEGAGHFQPEEFDHPCVKSINSEHICEEPKKISGVLGLPQRIKVDNGPKLIPERRIPRLISTKSISSTPVLTPCE